MTNIKNLQTNYRKLVLNKPWSLLLFSLIFTIVCSLGLTGLSQNPDNRIFFSKGDPNLIALEALEKTYTKNDNIFILVAPKNNDIFTSKFRSYNTSMCKFYPNFFFIYIIKTY